MGYLPVKYRDLCASVPRQLRVLSACGKRSRWPFGFLLFSLLFSFVRSGLCSHLGVSMDGQLTGLVSGISVSQVLCLSGSALPSSSSCDTTFPSHLGGALLVAMIVLVVLVLGLAGNLPWDRCQVPQKRRPCCQGGQAMSPWRFSSLEDVKMMDLSRPSGKSVFRRAAARQGTVSWKLDLRCGSSA